ncbi:MAG: hypothetical protein Q7V57_09955 [Actinomycetota bacterium]|nr:hypothetical protein [Actinomycetota bacterium]
MNDVTPPADPFSQAPAAAPDAAAASKPTPWKAIIGVVAVVAVVVVGVLLFTGGDDDSIAGPDSSGDTEGTWHLVRYAGDEGAAVEVLDEQLEVVRTVELTTEDGPALSRTTGRYIVTQSDGDTVEVLDLAQGGSREVRLPASNLILDRGLQSAAGSHAVYFSPGGGPLALVDLTAASVSVIGGSESGYYLIGARPLVSLYFAVDGSSTVVVPHDDPAGWWEVPGPVSFVEGRRTLVLGMVDGEPAVRQFDGEEQQGKTIAMKAPQLGGLLTETGAMTVDTGGGLWAIDFAGGEHETLGVLGIGVDAAVPVAGDRVLAWGAGGTRMILADGTVAEEIDPVASGSGEALPIIPVSGGIGTKCLTVQPGAQPRPTDARAVTVDIATGERLARFEGTPSTFSLDGCSAISMAAPSELMTDGVLAKLDLDRVFTYSPDLTQAIGVMLADDGQFYITDVATSVRTAIPEGSYFWAKF